MCLHRRKHTLPAMLLALVLLLSLGGCKGKFTEAGEDRVLSPDGTEYSFLCNEGFLTYLGKLQYVGAVEGERALHLGAQSRNGFYAIRGSKTDHLLIRIRPQNEWYAIYRRADLQDFDFSVDNCVRLELIANGSDLADHAACGHGLTDPEEIAAFLADVRSQKSPAEAGLYELVKREDGRLENVTSGASIYGFFAEEPELAVPLRVTSYNGLAYSVRIGQQEYLLPEKWIPRLLAPGESFP